LTPPAFLDIFIPVPTETICIVQLLCPARHCIMALLFDERDMTREAAIIALRGQVEGLALNPWCGICGSSVLAYEIGTTRFKTMAEATPFVRATEHANIMSRARLEAAGQTYDQRRKN
jgi:hypothetical protein